MKQLIRYISLVVVCICTFLLSGCSFVWTTENGDPATPEDIKASVEKEFSVVHPRLVLQSAVVEKEKPFQRNVYVFMMKATVFLLPPILWCIVQLCQRLVERGIQMQILFIPKNI